MIKFELNKGGYKAGWEKKLKKTAKAVFGEFKKSGVISVALVSSAKIKEYNKKYRKKDKSTDILTFVLGDAGCLGEIILSPADIRKRDRETGTSIKNTTVYLIIHGICHIFGFTHKSLNNRKKMEEKEKNILQKIYAKPIF